MISTGVVLSRPWVLAGGGRTCGTQGATTSRTLFLLCALLSSTMRTRKMVFSQVAQCTISSILGSSCVFSVPLYCFLEVWFGAILCSPQPALCFVNCVLLCCSAADGLYLARSCGALSQRAPAPVLCPEPHSSVDERRRGREH